MSQNFRAALTGNCHWKLALDTGQGGGHNCARQMKLTGTTYFAMRGIWSVRMVWRVSRPTWQTAYKINRPGQQEELT